MSTNQQSASSTSTSRTVEDTHPLTIDKEQVKEFRPLKIAGHTSDVYNPIKFPPIGNPSRIKDNMLLYRVEKQKGNQIESVKITESVLQDIRGLVKWYIDIKCKSFHPFFKIPGTNNFQYPAVRTFAYAQEDTVSLTFHRQEQAATFLANFTYTTIGNPSDKSIEEYFVKFFKRGRCHSKRYLTFVLSPEISASGKNPAKIPIRTFEQVIENFLDLYKDFKLVGAWRLIPYTKGNSSYKKALFVVLLPRGFDILQAEMPGFISQSGVVKPTNDCQRQYDQWFKILYEKRLSYCHSCFDEVHEEDEKCPRPRCFNCYGMGHKTRDCTFASVEELWNEDDIQSHGSDTDDDI